MNTQPEISNHQQRFPIHSDGHQARDFLTDTDLNQKQKDFCQDTNLKLRLLAPAGSGKTKSLLHRCLTQKKIYGADDPQGFLIFTFTKPASEELSARLEQPEFADLRDAAEISTLNAWGGKLLASNNSQLDLISSNDKLANCMRFDLKNIWSRYSLIEQSLTDHRLKFTAAKDFMRLLDEFKSLGYRHDRHHSRAAFLEHSEWLCDHGLSESLLKILKQLNIYKIIGEDFEFPISFEETFDNFFGFWREAVEWLYESGKITFEDQKYWALISLEEQMLSGTSQKLGNDRQNFAFSNRFRHILVDEFQDINVLDLNFLKTIAKAHETSLCIVGDDDQSIFDWRGATHNFLLKPDKYIEAGYRTHKLEINYRSPVNIVSTSQNLIKHNKKRVDKNIRAFGTDKAEIFVETLPTIKDSINFVTETVKRLLADREIKKIALIGRKRSQIIPYQIVFASENIPFCAAEDLRIFLSEAFNDLKDLLVFKAQSNTVNQFAPDCVGSLIKFCDKVRHSKLNQTDEAALRSYLIGKHPETIGTALEYLYEYAGPLKGDNRKGITSVSFYELISEFFKAPTVAETIKAASRNFAGLQQDYGKSLDDIFYADPPFLYLSEYAERYGDDFGKFIEDLNSAEKTLTAENDHEKTNDIHKRELHLMTALRTKGREFDAVIILDCNQNIFPGRYADTEDKLEAERRLFYVAVTRARKRLYFIVNQKMLGQSVAPSQFIREMQIK